MRKQVIINYTIKITNNFKYVFTNMEGYTDEPSRTYKTSDIFDYDNSDYNSVCNCIEKMAKTFSERAEKGTGLYETVEISIDELRIAGENRENDTVFSGLDIKTLKFSMDLFNAMVA